MKETKQLLIKNISILPLNTTIKVHYPFQLLLNTGDESLSTEESSQLDLTLEINEQITLLLQFDPSFVTDSFSKTALSKLEVIYKDHPNTDNVVLTGDVYYPNLDFESTLVSFLTIIEGCIRTEACYK